MKKYGESPPKFQKPKPAISPEARENQMIALAIDRAEERLLNGTASSQEIVFYLKLGSSKERLEQKETEQRIELAKAKTDAIKSSEDASKIYEKALMAFRSYSGATDEDLSGTE